MTADDSIRIVHLSAGLGSGGAEIMLYRLLKAAEGGSFAPTVISMTDTGTMGPRIEELGIDVHCLGMKRGRVQPARLWSLVRLLRRLRPQVLQTWMYHADLAGGLAARLAGGIPVCWGIHHTTLVAGQSRSTTLMTARLCARSSRFLPRKIVCCSESSREIHASLGYPESKMVVIPNGFDLDSFAPDPAARIRLRQELQIAPDAPVVGLVARFDPQKDHRNFVLAAASLVRSLPAARFVLCGIDVEWRNGELAGWIGEHGLTENFRLLGIRSDIPQLTQALDVAGTSSSFGEAFPLVVGEAMACGVPCVVTDIGDSAAMVGETGFVVPPHHPEDLAAAWLRILEMDADARRALGESARERVLRMYNLPDTVRRYAEVHRSVLR